MLRRQMTMQAIIAVLAQLILGANALGGAITMTDAEQQVGGMIGWTSWAGVENIVEEDWDPSSPQGLSNANLSVYLSRYGFRTTASLASVLVEDEVMVGGTSDTSAYWGVGVPIEAKDVHGATGSGFTLYFTRGPEAAYFCVFGQIGIDIDGYAWLVPEETFVYVRLSADDGGTMTTIWEDTLDGGGLATSIPVGHGVWLESGQNYVLEARAVSATHFELDYQDLQFRTAWFFLTAGISDSLPIEATVDIVEDTITTRTKWTTCNISLPEDCSVEDIDPDSILLNETIPGVRPSIKHKQKKLVVKFPASELNLEPAPDPYTLTVSGELTDGTLFEGTDDVTVIQKRGGKK